MKILKALIVFVIFASLTPASSNETIHKVTALRIESSEDDWVGKGKSYHYRLGDGDFSVYTTDRRRIEVRFSNGSDDWFLAFSVPDDELLEPGTYEDAERYSYTESEHPGLSIEVNNRGYDRSIGEFEILEIEYGMGNQIESFAANFTQRSEPDSPPLTGSIRYNSRAPLSARFQYREEVLLERYIQIPNSDEKMTVHSDSIQGSSFLQFRPFYSHREGLEVLFDFFPGICSCVFVAPVGGSFTIGKYECPLRDDYMFLNEDCPAMIIAHPREHDCFLFDNLIMSTNAKYNTFEVIKLERDANGKIQDLTLNFTYTDEFGQVTEGKIRKSHLAHPWIVPFAE